jgi:hypothetical protein
LFSIGPAKRSDETAELEVAAFAGKTVHTWIAFVSGSAVANSCYCGSVIVQKSKRQIHMQENKGFCKWYDGASFSKT